jgi:hypothetical protein
MDTDQQNGMLCQILAKADSEDVVRNETMPKTQNETKRNETKRNESQSGKRQRRSDRNETKRNQTQSEKRTRRNERNELREKKRRTKHNETKENYIKAMCSTPPPTSHHENQCVQWCPMLSNDIQIWSMDYNGYNGVQRGPTKRHEKISLPANPIEYMYKYITHINIYLYVYVASPHPKPPIQLWISLGFHFDVASISLRFHFGLGRRGIMFVWGGAPKLQPMVYESIPITLESKSTVEELRNSILRVVFFVGAKSDG